jgi:RNA polymerase sigma-70 factor, ECF subfamily
MPTPLHEQPDELLMVAYVAGGPAGQAALATLYRRHSPALAGYLRRGLKTPADADELVQETFLQLHRARFDYDPAQPLRPWLWTIALNLKREMFRKKLRRPLELLDDMDNPPEQVEPPFDHEQAESDVRVREALGQLPLDQQEVIQLHWFEGFSFPEIAPLVGASLSAVKVRAFRGYERLRKTLTGGHL